MIRRLLLKAIRDTRVLLAAAILLGIAAQFASRSTVQLWSFVLINVLIAQSINVLTGIAGQISLGHAGFLAIGAYGSALVVKAGSLPLPVGLVAATLLGAAAGWALSFAVGRVRELYLAMMTLGFGMIVYEVVREWNAVTGGVTGLSGIASPTLRNLKLFDVSIGEVGYFRLVLIVTVAVLWLLRNFVTGPHGRAFFAIHVSEIAAGSLGIPRAGTKRRAYTLSAAMIGLAGGFYAHLVGYLGPETFGLNRSVEALVMAIVGGLGTLAGPVLGAVLFTYLPDKLQFFADYQFMVYGLILLGSFLVLPRGLAGLFLPRTAFIKDLAPLLAAEPDLPPPAAGGEREVPLLSAQDLSISFLGLRALAGVSLEVRPGRIVGLVGPNGSGKSTLVNIVSGIYRADAGQVLFEGSDISHLAEDRIARLGIVRTFQDPRLVPSFTVRENVLLGAHRRYRQSALASALNRPDALREEQAMLGAADAIIELAGLSALADAVVRDLPYGDQRMTELARALLAEPRALLLDEPAAGLSEHECARLGVLLRRAKKQGIAVVLIEHHMEFLNDLVDEVVVLDSGRVIYQGDMAGMYRSPEVVEAYLGLPAGGTDRQPEPGTVDA